MKNPGPKIFSTYDGTKDSCKINRVKLIRSGYKIYLHVAYFASKSVEEQVIGSDKCLLESHQTSFVAEVECQFDQKF